MNDITEDSREIIPTTQIEVGKEYEYRDGTIIKILSIKKVTKGKNEYEIHEVKSKNTYITQTPKWIYTRSVKK